MAVFVSSVGAGFIFIVKLPSVKKVLLKKYLNASLIDIWNLENKCKIDCLLIICFYIYLKQSPIFFKITSYEKKQYLIQNLFIKKSVFLIFLFVISSNLYLLGVSNNGLPTACLGISAFFNLNTISGVSTYTWAWPNGWTYLGGQGARYLNVSAPYGNFETSGILLWTSNDCVGNSTPEVKYIYQDYKCGYN